MSTEHSGNLQNEIIKEEHDGIHNAKRVNVIPLDSVTHGTKTVPIGTAEAIASSQIVSSITLKALSTNTVAVYVGGTGVTTSNGFELLAGEGVSLDVDDLAEIFVISGSASQVVRYIAL